MTPARIAAGVAAIVILAAGGGYLIGSSISSGASEPQPIATEVSEPQTLAQAGATVTLPSGTVAGLPALRTPPAQPATRAATVAPAGSGSQAPAPRPAPAPAPPATTIFLQ